jgi:hypothetical protein
MKVSFAAVILLFALAIGVQRASAATVAIGAAKDSSIFENFPANSGGGAAGIYVGATATKSPRRGLIAFDVAGSVPAGATITSVQMTLYLALAGGPMDETIGLHRLTADWGEGTVGSDTPTVHFSGAGFDAEPGDATWEERQFGSAAWSNPGADGDYTPAASASAAVGPVGPDVANPTPYDWLSTQALVNDVQGWLDQPQTNFGWILISGDETSQGTAKAFFSRSAGLDALGFPLVVDVHPALTITYSIPEPGCGALVLPMLIIGALGRRRRGGAALFCRVGS